MLNNSFRKEMVEEINKNSKKYRLYKNKFGFYSVKPMPAEKTLSTFYEQKYFSNSENVISKGMDVGNKDIKERFHFERQYSEIVTTLKKKFPNKNYKSLSILDVGCGTGELLRYFYKRGFENLTGVEYKFSSSYNEFSVFEGDFLDFKSKSKFDCIFLNNVLEHVIHPGKVIVKVSDLLSNNGIIRIQVPNDLSYIQYAAIKKMKKPNYYFFSPPEHLHYFNFRGLKKFLSYYQFKIIDSMTFFPMELFLLMGFDYTYSNKIGKKCHEYRINMEYNIGEPYISEIYSKLCEIELGRVIIAYAKKNINNISASRR